MTAPFGSSDPCAEQFHRAAISRGVEALNQYRAAQGGARMSAQRQRLLCFRRWKSSVTGRIAGFYTASAAGGVLLTDRRHRIAENSKRPVLANRRFTVLPASAGMGRRPGRSHGRSSGAALPRRCRPPRSGAVRAFAVFGARRRCARTMPRGRLLPPPRFRGIPAAQARKLIVPIAEVHSGGLAPGNAARQRTRRAGARGDARPGLEGRLTGLLPGWRV